MSCTGLTISNIPETECIGDSLPKINGNFEALSVVTCKLSSEVAELSNGVTELSGEFANFITTTLGYKNRVFNGNMQISQRGTTFSGIASPSSPFTLDRWRVNNTTSTGVVTISQDTNVPTTTKEFGFSLKCQVTTADISLLTTEYLTIWQNIEGYNVRDLIGNTFTLSFWVRSSKTGIHSVAFRNGDTTPNFDASYVAEYTINAANTWEYKTITVNNGINNTLGSYWNFTNGGGLSVMFTIANGSTFSTPTLNTWQNANYISSTNTVNVLDAIGNTFYITGVQLERGPVATPFEHRPIGTELALCQRYYQTYPGDITNSGYTTNGTAQTYVMLLPVPMRISPVINFTPFNVATATLVSFDDGGSKDRIFFSVYSTSNPGVFQYTAQNATFNAEL